MMKKLLYLGLLLCLTGCPVPSEAPLHLATIERIEVVHPSRWDRDWSYLYYTTDGRVFIVTQLHPDVTRGSVVEFKRNCTQCDKYSVYPYQPQQPTARQIPSP